MKTIQELLAEVRDCEDVACNYAEISGGYIHKDRFDDFASGHRAACDRLLPVIEELLRFVSKKGAARECLDENLRALLERGGG